MIRPSPHAHYIRGKRAKTAPILQNTLQIYKFVAVFSTRGVKITPLQYQAMSNLWIVILVSVLCVAFFVVGMSLTIIFKGHFIDSEIATNKNMQRLGIKCAVQESREDTGTDCSDIGCTGNCSSCDIDHAQAQTHTETDAKALK